LVKEESGRLNWLVNNLLDLARIESKEAHLHMSVFCINELIRRTIIKFEKQIVEKKIQIVANFEFLKPKFVQMWIL
jgi:signal transduction histidine kinase